MKKKFFILVLIAIFCCTNIKCFSQRYFIYTPHKSIDRYCVHLKIDMDHLNLSLYKSGYWCRDKLFINNDMSRLNIWYDSGHSSLYKSYSQGTQYYIVNSFNKRKSGMVKSGEVMKYPAF